MKHGSAVIPKTFSSNTTEGLLQLFEQWNNEKLGNDFYVPSSRNRSIYGVTVYDHEVVTKALNEIAHHEIIRPLLDNVVGPDAALLDMFVLTNLPGAGEQTFHDDHEWYSSPRHYPHIFTSAYLLFIALVPATNEVGTTQVCPGTHRCMYQAKPDEAVMPDCFGVELKAGDSLLINRSTFHRGGGHAGKPGDPSRVFFFLGFTANTKDPKLPHEKGYIEPIGSFNMKTSMQGHTLKDLESVSYHPWTILDAFGLNPWRQKGHTYTHWVLRRLANGYTWFIPLPRWLAMRWHLRRAQLPIKWLDLEEFWMQYWQVAVMWALSILLLGKLVTISLSPGRSGSVKAKIA